MGLLMNLHKHCSADYIWFAAVHFLYRCAKNSRYGAGNPREFTAEMFVGLVYRNIDINEVNDMATRKENAETTKHIRKFTRDEAFLRMYSALGGPVPNGMAGIFAKL